MSNEENLVVLKSFHSLPEAEIVKAFLADHGIEVFLHDKHLNTMYAGALGTMTGGYRLRVSASQLKQAQELMAKQNPALEGELLGGAKCPQCGSETTELETQSRSTVSKMFLSLLFFLPTGGAAIEQWKCQECGHHWKTKPLTSIGMNMLAFILLAFVVIWFVTTFKLY